MCGIFCILLPIGVKDNLLREKAFQLSRRQRHRGPDSTGVRSGASYCIVQERLSIIGLQTGKQPLLSYDQTYILAANGEIYNYRELAELVSNRRGCPYSPRSDSDVILALYEEFGRECASLFWGMFAFIVYNRSTGEIFAARDGLGVCSLYYGVDQEDGRLYIASEMKCIPCDVVRIFPPGCYMAGTVNNWEMVEYYKPAWSSMNTVPANIEELREKLSQSVACHMKADVPVVAFLSGGINSSIICALAQQHCGGNLKTFSVGLPHSRDLALARRVARYLNTDHHEVVFTVEEGIDLIPELIWHLETYDPFTIRSAIPMYILSRALRSSGFKVVLSGEGADEIFGGYLYFHKAPDTEEFRQETIKRLLDVHLSDGLRANKTSLAQSVELRAPFLGSPFVNYAMTIHAEDRMPAKRTPDTPAIEKYLLRKAFENMLPNQVIWRQKEQFADGVGVAWINGLKAYAEERVDDEAFEQRQQRFPHNTPKTKEEYLYREIFAMEYPGEDRAHTVVMWKPRSDWGCCEESSGRAQDVHRSKNPDDVSTELSSDESDESETVITCPKVINCSISRLENSRAEAVLINTTEDRSI